MTLLSVVKDVCATVGVLVPQSIFSGISGNRTMQEMLSLANEMAQRIAYDARDWTLLRTVCVFNGDGVSNAFNLPANYKRMLLTSDVWGSASALQPMMFVPDTNEWLQRRALSRVSSWGEWTMIGGQMQISPVMAVGATASFAYLDKNCINLASGGRGDSFMADGDSFALDERVLKLGMIWQWKAEKGSAYAEDMTSYETALDSVMGRDGPAPILIGRRPSSLAVKVAYPWPVPS